ncbi:MAG: HEAT repeat domain-containing protein [Polyangia bacterium]
MSFSWWRVGWIPCAISAMLLAGAVTCRRPSAAKQQPLWLGPVAIATAAGASDESSLVDRETLAQKVRLQLLQAGIFAGQAVESTDRDAAVARPRITLSMELVRADSRTAVRADVRLNVSTRPAGAVASHFAEDVRANAEMLYDPDTHPDKKAVFQRLAERAVGDLLAAYIARQKLWSADHQAVHAALLAPGEMRLEAIRVVAAHGLRDEVPSLVSLLSDDEEDIRDAALGALVEMRDARAVPALTKTKSMKDRREMRKIVDALAALGGQEATDYLSFVADAHEDEEIRNMATAALLRLKGRSPARSQTP